jgi:hypothetical protein
MQNINSLQSFPWNINGRNIDKIILKIQYYTHPQTKQGHNTFSKVAGIKVSSTKKSVAFLYSNNEQRKKIGKEFLLQ